MAYPFNYKDVGATVWYHKRHSKSNQYCPYCGIYIGDKTAPSNKEHLIGRNFIPNIANDGKSFNFIFRSCVACNSEKSKAERHISSVTLFNSPSRFENKEIENLALRKASQDHHHITGLSVDRSTRSQAATVDGLLNFNFSIPPQLDPQYCKALAFYHVQGLFALVTSKDPLNKYGGMRLLPFDQFYYFGSYIVNDWGNPRLVEVVNKVRDWPCVALVDAAGGFFKVVIKKSLEGNWWWALEWNKYLRLTGGICNPGETPQLFNDLPVEPWSDVFVQPDGSLVRIKTEFPLSPEDDELFSPTSWCEDASTT